MVSRRTRVAFIVVAQEIRYSSSGIPQEHGDCEGIMNYQPGGETSPASCV